MNTAYIQSVLTVLKSIEPKIAEWDAEPGAVDHTGINLKLLIPPLARDSITAIEHLQEENEQLRERVRTDSLDYIHKINDLNGQLGTCRQALKYQDELIGQLKREPNPYE